MCFIPNTERIAYGFGCSSWIKNCKMGLLFCSGSAVQLNQLLLQVSSLSTVLAYMTPALNFS